MISKSIVKQTEIYVKKRQFKIYLLSYKFMQDHDLTERE